MKFVFEKASYFLTEGGEGPRGDMMGGIPIISKSAPCLPEVRLGKYPKPCT
jgi:hypothetical protein